MEGRPEVGTAIPAGRRGSATQKPRADSAQSAARGSWRPRPLFGRDHAIRRLTAMLAEARPGVITITGPGGVGKSALIAAVGQHLDQAFDGSMMVVDQTSYDAESVRQFLADEPSDAAAGTATSDRDGPLPAPRAPRPPRRRLLIIDPADDLAATVGDLSSSLPRGSTILACAIRPLGVPTERTVPLGPLPVAHPDDEPESLAANPAVQLFRWASPTADPSPPPDDLKAVATVCRQLAGWPLAIEQSAALTRLLAPRALADTLGKHPEIPFEPVASPSDPTRLLPSLRVAFDRTWQRLTASERSMLRATTMFSGPFGVEQAAVVAAQSLTATVRTLTRLVGLHLVDRAAEHADRFTMTPLIRQYVRWSFGRSAPERPVRARHVDLVCTTARTSAEASHGGDELTAMRAIGEVRDELVPVLDHLLATGATDRALALAADLAPGLVQSGHFDLVTDRVDSLLRRRDLPEGPALAAALVGFADAAFTGIHGEDRHELASDRIWRGVAMARESPEPLTQLWALSVVIRAWPVMRDVDVAAKAIAEGSELARQIGEPRWLARFEAWSGMLCHQTGDLVGAAALGSTALARGRRCGDLRARLLAGLLLRTMPEPPVVPGGLPSLVDLLPLTQALVEPRLESIILAAIARAWLKADRSDEAAYWGARALEVASAIDAWHGIGFAIMSLAGVAHARGDLDQAAVLHGMVADRLVELSAYLPPWSAADYDDLVSSLTAATGAALLNERLRAGAALSWRDATATALAYAYRASAGAGAGAGARGSDSDSAGTDPAPAPPTRPRPAPQRAVPTSSPDRPAPPVPAQRDPALPEAAPPDPNRLVEALTPRENQVLDLIAQGLDTRAIASQLRVSVNAVSHHTSNVLAKLGVENRTQAAIWAVHRQYAGPQ